MTRDSSIAIQAAQTFLSVLAFADRNVCAT